MTPDTKKHTIYAVGYQGKRVDQLVALALEHDAIIVDVRLNPYSPNPRYTRENLRISLGDQYTWCRSLGNLNYRSGGMIEIADYPAGREFLRRLERSTILMCACREPLTCHRHTLLELLAADGFLTCELDADHGTQLSLF